MRWMFKRYAPLLINPRLVSSIFADEVGRITLRWRATGNDSLFIEYLLTDEQVTAALEPMGTTGEAAFPVTLNIQDDMATVRLGPGARWQGYSSLYDGVYVC